MNTLRLFLRYHVFIVAALLLNGCATNGGGPSFAGYSPDQLKQYILDVVNQQPPLIKDDGNWVEDVHLDLSGNTIEYSSTIHTKSVPRNGGGFTKPNVIVHEYTGPISSLSPDVRYNRDADGYFIVLNVLPGRQRDFKETLMSRYTPKETCTLIVPNILVECREHDSAVRVASAFLTLISPPSLSSNSSSYAPGTPNSGGDSAPDIGGNYNRAFNTPVSAVYTVAPQVMVNSINGSGSLPITVTYQKNGVNAAMSYTFDIRSEDDTRPVLGSVELFIGQNDPPSGQKTVNMWIQAHQSTRAIVSPRGYTLGFGVGGSGQDKETQVIVP